MNIEVGECFVVRRGVELNNKVLSLFPLENPFADSILGKENEEKPPTYDRSHERRIYRALEVCGEHIAAECVFDEDTSRYSVQGKRISLNTSEVEIWPITEKYVECFLI